MMTLSTQKDPGWTASSDPLSKINCLMSSHSHLVALLNQKGLSHLTQNQASRMINIRLEQIQRAILSKNQAQAKIIRMRSHREKKTLKDRQVVRRETRKVRIPLMLKLNLLFKHGALDSSANRRQMVKRVNSKS